MTDYKTIRGKKVKTFTSDPPATVTEGQVWYNSGDTNFKSSVIVSAWASGGNLNTARKSTQGCGTLTAGLCFGGNTGAPLKNESEEYDGSSWTEGNNLNTARYEAGGAGTQTAGLCVGGSPGSNETPPGYTEEYDGTSWSEQNDLSTHRMSQGGCPTSGTQTAAIAVGGYSNPPGARVNNTENYDGTNWTNGTAFPSVISSGIMAGTQTAGFYISGNNGSSITSSANYDGSSWTTGAAVNTARQENGGLGSQTQAIINHGKSPGASPDALVSTELYDGSSWAASSNSATPRNGGASSGAFNNTASFYAGGTGPIATTEEWSSAATVKVITDS